MENFNAHESGKTFNTFDDDPFTNIRAALSDSKVLAQFVDKTALSFLPELQIGSTPATIVRDESGRLVQYSVPGLVQTFLYEDKQEQPNEVDVVINGVKHVKFTKGDSGWTNDASAADQNDLMALVGFDSIIIDQKTGSITKKRTDENGVEHASTMYEDGTFQEHSSDRDRDRDWGWGNLDGAKIMSEVNDLGRSMSVINTTADGRQSSTLAQFDKDGNLIEAEFGNPVVSFANGTWNTKDGKAPQGFESDKGIMKVTQTDGTVITFDDTTGSGQVTLYGEVYSASTKDQPLPRVPLLPTGRV